MKCGSRQHKISSNNKRRLVVYLWTIIITTTTMISLTKLKRKRKTKRMEIGPLDIVVRVNYNEISRCRDNIV
jgi:hypothetical protein